MPSHTVTSPAVRRYKLVFISSHMRRLLRVYFKIGNYHSCKHMINPVERSMRGQPSIVDSGYIPLADLVTYRFYKGRLAVYEDK